VGAAFIFDFLHSTLTFLKFSPVMAKYFFPMVPPNFIICLYIFFYKFCHMIFMSIQSFYTDLLYLNIFVQAHFYDVFCLYDFVLKKLYIFYLA